MKLDSTGNSSPFRFRISSIIASLFFCTTLAGSMASALSTQEAITNQPGRVLGTDSENRNVIATPGREAIQGMNAPVQTEGITRVGAGVTDQFLANELATQAASIARSDQSTKSTIQTAIAVALLGLAPILILMTTCYIRLFVVLGLLRQAIGAQQLPSTQMLTAISFFVTLLVMTPVWQEIKTVAIDPSSRSDGTFDWQMAFERGIPPLKKFMTCQIEVADNQAALQVFYQHQSVQQKTTVELPENLNDVPLNIVLPAFLISELKVAFLLGFQVYLPFLILDLVVSTLTVSMGMVMLPPSMVSLPLKLILFVMVDGWNLVIGMLLQSFGV